MIKLTLCFSNPAYLSVKNKQLVIKLPEVENNDTLPESFKQSAVTKLKPPSHLRSNFGNKPSSPRYKTKPPYSDNVEELKSAICSGGQHKSKAATATTWKPEPPSIIGKTLPYNPRLCTLERSRSAKQPAELRIRNPQSHSGKRLSVERTVANTRHTPPQQIQRLLFGR